MTHFAHYQVLTDDTVLSLPNMSPSGGTGGTQETFNKQRLIWNPANDIELNAAPAGRPILCFNVDPESAVNCKLRVWILTNAGADKSILNWTFNGDQAVQFMEPFRLGWVNTGDNPIMFELVERDAGSLLIRNVIVMYQRE